MIRLYDSGEGAHKVTILAGDDSAAILSAAEKYKLPKIEMNGATYCPVSVNKVNRMLADGVEFASADEIDQIKGVYFG